MRHLGRRRKSLSLSKTLEEHTQAEADDRSISETPPTRRRSVFRFSGEQKDPPPRSRGRTTPRARNTRENTRQPRAESEPPNFSFSELRRAAGPPKISSGRTFFSDDDTTLSCERHARGRAALSPFPFKARRRVRSCGGRRCTQARCLGVPDRWICGPAAACRSAACRSARAYRFSRHVFSSFLVTREWRKQNSCGRDARAALS